VRFCQRTECLWLRRSRISCFVEYPCTASLPPVAPDLMDFMRSFRTRSRPSKRIGNGPERSRASCPDPRFGGAKEGHP
jgi:hypothetical protein